MKILERFRVRPDILRFAVVGVVNTGVDFGVFALLFYAAGLGLATANVIAFSVAVTNSYFLNKYWSFAGARPSGRPALQYAAFVVVSVLGMAINTGIVVGLALWLPAIIAKAAAAVVTPVWNFLCYRYLVFRE